MDDVGERAAALTAAPAGCAMLLAAEEAGLTPEAAARPAVAVHAAAEGVAALDVWRPGHDWVIAAVLAEGPRLLPFARAILSRPGAAWWFAPLDRAAQQWLGPAGTAPTPDRIVTPTGAPTTWERYANKPEGRLFTSTGAEGTTSLLAAHYHGVNDYDDPPPYARYRLRAAADARVFEIADAHDWRRLCLRYPTEGEDGQVVPDWAAVARAWDAVHLTLGGVLLAEQVRIDGPEGWTRHWAWQAEMTAWLRWRFDAVERLPAVVGEFAPGDRHPTLPEAAAGLSWPWKFHAPPDGVSSLRIPPYPVELGAPIVLLPLGDAETAGGDRLSARVAPDFDEIVTRDAGGQEPGRAIDWPPPFPVAGRGAILEIAPTVLPIRLWIRLFPSIDRDGVPQGAPVELAWPLNDVDSRIHVARRGPAGPWEATFRLPKGWDDVYVAATADCALPGEPAPSLPRRFPADGTAWILVLRRTQRPEPREPR